MISCLLTTYLELSTVLYLLDITSILLVVSIYVKFCMMTKLFYLFLLFGSCNAFSASPTTTTSLFKEIDIQPVEGGTKIALEDYLKTEGKSLFIFGTYAADFNGTYILNRWK